MAKAKFDIKSEATRGLYAGAGVADFAVEAVREYVADVQARFADLQKDVSARVVDVQKNVSTLEYKPEVLREQVTARIAELQAEARNYPAKVQKLVDENVATASGTYDGLVKRGETLVGRIRRQQSTKATASSAKTTVAKAKTTKTQSTSATKSTAKKASTTARKKAPAAKSSAKATGTAAKKTASNAAKATSDAASKVGD